MERHQRVLFGVAIRLLGDGDQAADAVQDAFVRAYRKLQTFDRRHKFFSWVYRILVNECLNVRRSRRALEPLDARLAAREDPHRDAERAELRADVQAALLRLPSISREVIVLRHYANLSVRRDRRRARGPREEGEIAALLGAAAAWGGSPVMEKDKMIAPRDEEFLHRALDGTLSDEEAAVLRARLVEDPALRARADSLEQLAALLGAPGRPSPPTALAERVMAAVAESPPPRRGWRERVGALAGGMGHQLFDGFPHHSEQDKAHVESYRKAGMAGGGVIVAKKALWGIAGLAVIVVLAVVYFNGTRSVDQGAQGTIGAADRYRGAQPSSKDVVLDNAEVQAFLQSDSFDRLLKDKNVRALLGNAALCKALADPAVAKAFADPAIAKAFADPAVSKAFADPAVAKAFADPAVAKAFADPAVAKAFADPAVAKAFADPAVAKAFADPAVAKAFADPAVAKAFADPAVAKAFADPAVAKAFADPAVAKAFADPAVAKAFADPAVAKALNKPAVSKAFADPAIAKAFADPAVAKAFADPAVAKAFADPAVSKAFADPAVSKAFADPAVSKAFADPAVSKAFADPAVAKAFTDPAVAKAFADPAVSKAFADPAVAKAFADPAVSKAFADPAVSKAFADPAISKAFADPAISKAFADPAISKAFADPAISKAFDNPDLTKAFTNAAFRQALQNPSVFSASLLRR